MKPVSQGRKPALIKCHQLLRATESYWLQLSDGCFTEKVYCFMKKCFKTSDMNCSSNFDAKTDLIISRDFNTHLTTGDNKITFPRA